MNKIAVDFSKITGPIKPMHAVNNGPKKAGTDQTRGNLDSWVKAGIPFARNHDASFCADYGGEHTVDVCAIFPDFDADVNDPASYDFILTDEYTKTILDAGTKVFYRLGNKIEHWKKKYGTLPPKDFQKWAEICEHIIMHYNEGWADGHHWNIEYWEIWNEPDLDPDDSPNKRTWGGTAAQFYELYRITATHLKTRFPHLKIGGPALAHDVYDWMDGFLAAMTDPSLGPKVPMDFFSWHIYLLDPEKMVERTRIVREKLDRAGYTKTESICNEWNYIKDWDKQFVYSIEVISSMKGAAFTTACMLASQHTSMDMLMYYDARIDTVFNGMFDLYTLRPRKGYYPFKMFHELYKLGSSASVQIEGEQLYAAAAWGCDGNALMLCHYTDDDKVFAPRTISLALTGGASKYDMYLLDQAHDMALVGQVDAQDEITIAPNSVVLLTAIC